jgi:phage head maturation protease
MSIRNFKAACSAKPKGKAPASFPTLRKTLAAKSVETAARQLKFTISTNAVDLDNDTVDQSGWDLSVYRSNPVVLWNHDPGQLPPAKCVWIGLEGGKLKAVAQFAPASMPVIGELSEALFQMCRTGFLSATSVGFMPLDYDIANERDDDDSYLPPVDFKRQRLLEFSLCGIPANSEALIEPGQREPGTTSLAPAQAAVVSAAARLEVSRAFDRARRIARIL